mmetsp:Transcript_343/g.666  ORF Transcript_343/g.666 Transcript_343/m.666 type:complete len:316 (+) Transcript_343:2724-3671(+)
MGRSLYGPQKRRLPTRPMLTTTQQRRAILSTTPKTPLAKSRCAAPILFPAKRRLLRLAGCLLNRPLSSSTARTVSSWRWDWATTAWTCTSIRWCSSTSAQSESCSASSRSKRSLGLRMRRLSGSRRFRTSASGAATITPALSPTWTSTSRVRTFDQRASRMSCSLPSFQAGNRRLRRKSSRSSSGSQTHACSDGLSRASGPRGRWDPTSTPWTALTAKSRPGLQATAVLNPRRTRTPMASDPKARTFPSTSTRRTTILAKARRTRGGTMCWRRETTAARSSSSGGRRSGSSRRSGASSGTAARLRRSDSPTTTTT